MWYEQILLFMETYMKTILEEKSPLHTICLVSVLQTKNIVEVTSCLHNASYPQKSDYASYEVVQLVICIMITYYS